jgi:hypothetical protein
MDEVAIAELARLAGTAEGRQSQSSSQRRCESRRRGQYQLDDPCDDPEYSKNQGQE